MNLSIWMVYFLHKLTLSSSETFLKSIFDVDRRCGQETDVIASSIPIMQLEKGTFRLLLHDQLLELF